MSLIELTHRKGKAAAQQTPLVVGVSQIVSCEDQTFGCNVTLSDGRTIPVTQSADEVLDLCDGKALPGSGERRKKAAALRQEREERAATMQAGHVAETDEVRELKRQAAEATRKLQEAQARAAESPAKEAFDRRDQAINAVASGRAVPAPEGGVRGVFEPDEPAGKPVEPLVPTEIPGPGPAAPKEAVDRAGEGLPGQPRHATVRQAGDPQPPKKGDKK